MKQWQAWLVVVAVLIGTPLWLRAQPAGPQTSPAGPQNDLVERIQQLEQRVVRLENRLAQARAEHEQLRASFENQLAQLEADLRKEFELRTREGYYRTLEEGAFNRVTSGMTPDQVREILGPPSDIGTVQFGRAQSKPGTSWVYQGKLDGKNKKFYIRFRDDKVVTKEIR